MREKYFRVEKMHDDTVVYQDTKTGELLYKQVLNGMSKFIKDDNKLQMTHTNDDGTTIRRKKNHDGTQYFLDENGKPMERQVDRESGKVIFKVAKSGNTITYKYNKGTEQPQKDALENIVDREIQSHVIGGTIKANKNAG